MGPINHRTIGVFAVATLAALLVPRLADAQATDGGALLRGSEDTDEVLLRGRIGLDAPAIRLLKPAAVTRIQAAPAAPPLRPSADGDMSMPAMAPVPVEAPALPPPEAPPRTRRPDPADDPWAPVGYRAGAFLLRPSIEVDFGYDDNPGQQPGTVQGARFVTVQPKIDFASDWSRHELRGSVEGGFQHFFGIEDADRPTLNAVVDGRLDVRRDTAVEAQLRLALDTERIGSDGVPADAATRPLTTAFGGTLGVVRGVGPVSIALRGAIDRNLYQEVVPGQGRNYTTYATSLRGTYELSPAIQPFLEMEADTRRHDDPESDGVRRDSRGADVKAGAVLDLTGAIRGEASVGYGARLYDDPALQDIGGVLADASLVWTPSALTTVTLKAGTTFDETTVTDASAAVSRIIGIRIDHALRRNLIASGALSYEVVDYDGSGLVERTIDASLGIEYRLSRTFAVKATYEFERLNSTAAGADYTANALLVGLRMQR